MFNKNTVCRLWSFSAVILISGISLRVSKSIAAPLCSQVFSVQATVTKGAFNSGNTEFETVATRNDSLSVGAWAETQGSFDGTRNTKVGIATASFGDTGFRNATYFADPSLPINLNPAIAIDSHDVIHLVFLSGAVDQSAGALNYVKSTDRGLSWSHVNQISKSIGAISDKPSIHVAEDGIIAIAYAEIKVKSRPDGKSAESIDSTTKLLTSVDNGMSWSQRTLAVPEKIGAAQGYNGFQGQYIDGQNVDWQMSLAEYGGGGVYVYKAGRLSDLGSSPVLVSKHSVMAPITKLFRSQDIKGSAGVLWYGAHYFQTVSFSLSTGSNGAWGPEVRVSDSGTLAAAQFIKGKVVVLFAEKAESTIRTKIKVFDSRSVAIEERILGEVTLSSPDEYIGAEQSLLVSPDGQSVIAYWVDYANHGKVMTSQILVK